MDGIRAINQVIEYIENHITEPIDCNIFAKMTGLSLYEFRRIFSFAVGMPIGEYIRKRRLTLAAIELLRSDSENITEIAVKYGYSGQSAFTTAFKAMHHIAPNSLKKEVLPIELLSKPSFEITRTGPESIPMKIVRKGSFRIIGFCGMSDENDTDCCEAVWCGFYENGVDLKTKEFSEDGKLYAVYDNKQTGGIRCTIGVKSSESAENLVETSVPDSEWAIFSLNGTDDDYVASVYAKILYEWLPSAGLTQRTDVPNTEIYPFDMESENFSWEVAIPIKS
ncbi:MAG TPA: hypothetical protein DCE08_07010 [Ruminococcaceae bacterium]|nr:hypothetical protein [Oscillospiraceae bacterium]